ncbi:MAG: DUF3791 domain-containing protein [Candidatus Cryptobacteroides sp.]
MTRDVLNFVTFCVGAISLRLNIPRNEVYARLKKSGILYDYIVPGYEILHTYSRNYIVDDITDFMKQKGVLS